MGGFFNAYLLDEYRAIKKLAAYEDTGLQPEEVHELPRTALQCRYKAVSVYDLFVEFQCDHCGRQVDEESWRGFRYCPGCGAEILNGGCTQ